MSRILILAWLVACGARQDEVPPTPTEIEDTGTRYQDDCTLLEVTEDGVCLNLTPLPTELIPIDIESVGCNQAFRPTYGYTCQDVTGETYRVAYYNHDMSIGYRTYYDDAGTLVAVWFATPEVCCRCGCRNGYWYASLTVIEDCPDEYANRFDFECSTTTTP